MSSQSPFDPSRRGFMKRAAALSALLIGQGVGLLDPLHWLPRTARAIGRPTQIDIAYLMLPGAEANPRPGVIELMLLELARNTSVEVQVEAVALRPSDPHLFDHPVAFLFGTRSFPEIPEAERSRLEQYLRSGGILFIDDSSGLETSSFDTAVRREVARLFPRNELERIPDSHVLFRTFYLLSRIGGRADIKSYLEGVTLGEEMTPIIYSRNDIAGAFARDPTGGYLYECVPGGDNQRQLAYKLGINLLMYALCLNYKHDLTHVRALLNRPRGVWDE